MTWIDEEANPPSLASETTPTADELREALDVARGLRISPRAYRLIEWLFDNIPALLADRDRVEREGGDKWRERVDKHHHYMQMYHAALAEEAAARLRPERPEGAAHAYVPDPGSSRGACNVCGELHAAERPAAEETR